MTGDETSFVTDPHKVSWLLLMAIAVVGAVTFLIVKMRRRMIPPRMKRTVKYDIVTPAERSSPERR